MVIIYLAPLDGIMLLFNYTQGASNVGSLAQLIHSLNKSEIVIFNNTKLVLEIIK